MTEDDPFLIDPERISDKPLVREGILKPGELERLDDSLANGEGELRYRVTAQLDPQRRRRMSCIINGFVFLTCQRTMDVFRHDLSVSDRLVLVGDEGQLPPPEEESDAEDYLVADGPLDLRDLVEDAVLLSLPMVPRKPGLEDGPEGDGGAVAGKVSPFAVLAGLKKTK